MKRSARSAMAAGVSMLAVSAVIAPVHPTDAHASDPTVRLTAAVEPLQPGAEPPHIPALFRSSGLLPSVVPTALPGAPSVLAVPIAPTLANNIDNLYLAVEPWVQYGFEVAAAAIAWVPYVGFLSGLIMDGYFFGEATSRAPSSTSPTSCAVTGTLSRTSSTSVSTSAWPSSGSDSTW